MRLRGRASARNWDAACSVLLQWQWLYEAVEVMVLWAR